MLHSWACFPTKRLVANIGVMVPIKEDAKQIVQHLKNDGFGVAIVTGYDASTAGAVASQLGITMTCVEVFPDGKAKMVVQMQAAGQTVAFVGDGINDAPALAQADVGIAIGTGTDVAIEAADVVLSSGALSGVVNALQVSRRTMTNIRQNLFWAFGYNVALVPVATGVLYPVWGILLSPMLGAEAMAASSVLVLTNALRLRFIKSALKEAA